MGYLIFICSNRVSFYKVQCSIFAKLLSILILYWHTLFLTCSWSGNAFIARILNYKYNYNLKFSITIIQVQVIVIQLPFQLQLLWKDSQNIATNSLTFKGPRVLLMSTPVLSSEQTTWGALSPALSRKWGDTKINWTFAHKNWYFAATNYICYFENFVFMSEKRDA